MIGEAVRFYLSPTICFSVGWLFFSIMTNVQLEFEPLHQLHISETTQRLHLITSHILAITPLRSAEIF